MQPDEIVPGSPEDWLSFAQSDLALAQIGLGGRVLAASLCFQAQQAAEKGLKGALVARGISFPKTHNIRALLQLFPPEIRVPPEIEQAVRLTPYATFLRYPGASEPISGAEYREALGLAEAAVSWAEQIIRAPG